MFTATPRAVAKLAARVDAALKDGQRVHAAIYAVPERRGPVRSVPRGDIVGRAPARPAAGRARSRTTTNSSRTKTAHKRFETS